MLFDSLADWVDTNSGCSNLAYSVENVSPAASSSDITLENTGELKFNVGMATASVTFDIRVTDNDDTSTTYSLGSISVSVACGSNSTTISYAGSLANEVRYITGNIQSVSFTKSDFTPDNSNCQIQSFAMDGSS